ncbi:M23 family metallopeptidase [Brachyspira aalborgi]|uniref:M23 family metallopeptidase n=1 Tax=Brachyspira aalborgi TaxID=29522 RepID=A0A5C8E6M4_9SPIR|nr:M23 family metallopeptidase [Brachyspira aalborgi]TXJ33123.1 M23 family metallopeptidase [Brachyspira aalborgi]
MYKNKKKKRNYKYITKEKSESSKRFDRFSKFLKHRLYFMFIPHSKKKTITLSLPVYAIIILVIIVSGALLVTFSFLTKNTIIANKIEILSGSYNDKLEEIDSLEILFNSLVTNDYYRADMLNLVNNLKANDIKNHNADLTNYDFEEKTAIINARAEEFEKLKSYLEELKVNVNSKNSALESVPSILPIDSRYAVISIPYQKDSLISKGIGFETIAGTVIRSAATGTVNNIYYDNNKGFTIVIYHKFGIITTYRGLATSFVSEDKDLKKGEIIGNAKTGVFEYELKLASENVNPLIFTSLN